MSKRWFYCETCNTSAQANHPPTCCQTAMVLGRPGVTEAARAAVGQGQRRFYTMHPEERERRRQKMLGSKQSEATIAKRVARNRGKKRSEEQKWNLSQGNLAAQERNPELTKERIKRLAASRHLNPCSHPGPEHPRAVSMWVKDPSGAKHYIKNIRHFVATHPHLFSEADLVQRPDGSCRASKGLSLIRAHKYSAEGHVRDSARLGWKGWLLLE